MGLFKLLLTGEDEAWAREQLADLAADDSNDSVADEVAADKFACDIGDDLEDLLSSNHMFDERERYTQAALQAEATQARECDELLARIGQLHLAVESLLRLLTEKGVVTELDLRRMEAKVDREDGATDGEYQKTAVPLPSHCPRCEAKLSPGKRMCVLCGHRIDVA